MPDPTKTIQVRIDLPEELHSKLSAEAAEDERTLSTYIVRVLRGLRPRIAAPPARQPVYPPLPVVEGPDRHPIRVEGEVPSVQDTYALPPVPADVEDLPIEQWDDDRLVRTLQEKRTAAQEERARIASLQSGPEAEKAKAELERFLILIGVIEREFMKRRGKQARKAPSPPRQNPQPRLS